MANIDRQPLVGPAEHGPYQSYLPWRVKETRGRIVCLIVNKNVC